MIDRRKVTPDMFARFHLGMKLYKWQVKAMLSVWMKHKTAVRAANGSGKTACLVTPLLLWFLWRYPKGRALVTSGSWNQIATQLFYNLHLHKHRPCFKGWTFNNSAIMTPQGGFIVGLSTVNPGRAEGYHERVTDEREELDLTDFLKVINAATDKYDLMEDEPDSPVMYIVDEAKTVPDPIFTAIDRCTITYRLYCSSPGGPSGQFYRCFSSEARAFTRIVVQAAYKDANGNIDYERTDCPHIKRSKIRDIVNRYGLESPLTLSMVFAEFMLQEGSLVITEMELQHAIDNPPPRKEGIAFGASDFAAGGDEDTTSVCAGNWARVVDAFRLRNTVQSRRRHIKTLQQWGVEDGNAIGDADGLGKVQVQDVQEEGFDMEEFHGGAPCEEDDNYRNQITAAYNITALLIKRGLLDVSEMDKGLPGEGELFKQLTTRKNEIDDRGKLRIQPKEKYKQEGYHSPDRADSFCMAVYWAWIQSGGWDGLFRYESDNGEQTPERATRTMAQEVEETLIAPHDEDLLIL
ncbi:MAG: DEAD/DEAH box helicase family protein [Akkermansia sp.]|nr:DEAD/DEAH box helicase family protein [Akkermansia sp.]